MKLFVMPYNIGSESARNLARQLRVKRIKGHKRLPNNSVVINWGNSQTHPINNLRLPVKIINKPEAVAKAANKIKTFEAFTRYNVPTVEHTASKDVAMSWLSNGEVVVCRKLTSASQGAGIVIVTQDDSYLPNAPLYTKLIPKAHEYRVHVAFGKVIDFSKKKRREGQECNEYIKSFNHGWVFCREAISLPDKVKDAALKAMQSLGLDFGALDIIYKEKDNKVAVLEVNSAPGIEGTTLEKYTNLFKEMFYVY